MSNRKKIAVFGVGNSLMGDDGIAEAVLKELKRRKIPGEVRLVNVAGDPLRIAEELPELDLAIIIDAADMGLKPGEIRVFKPDEAEYPHKTSLVSNHGLGLAQVLKILRAMGLDERVYLIGIQPFLMEGTISFGLSPEMRNKVYKVADLVVETIQKDCR